MLYRAAVDALIALHKATAPIELATYDDDEMIAKALLMLEWFMPLAGLAVDAAGRDAFVAAWRAMLPAVHRVPKVVVLRDYHVDNLLWLPERGGVASVGQLDFQDATWGPATYDLVSLLEDARRDVAPTTVAARAGALSRRLPAARPGRFRRRLRGDRRPAQLSHPGRLLPPADARRQARLPGPHGPGLGPCRDRPLPSGLRAAEGLGRPLRARGEACAGRMTPLARGMVLCAGRGQRLRPLTDSCPKPLIEVAGRCLLDRMLDHLTALDTVVVNAWHLAERIADHVARRRRRPAWSCRARRSCSTPGAA